MLMFRKLSGNYMEMLYSFQLEQKGNKRCTLGISKYSIKAKQKVYAKLYGSRQSHKAIKIKCEIKGWYDILKKTEDVPKSFLSHLEKISSTRRNPTD